MRSSIFDGGCQRTSDGGVRFGSGIRLSPHHAEIVEQTILALAGLPARSPKPPDPWHAKRDAACREIERRHRETGRAYRDIVEEMRGESEWRAHFAARSRTRGPVHVVDAVLQSFYRWKRSSTAPPGARGDGTPTPNTTDSY